MSSKKLSEFLKFWQTLPMRQLTTTICLTVALIFGSAGVSRSADFQKGFEALQRGDFATVLREWEPIAKQGDAKVQATLGSIYVNGANGVARDHEAAVRWFRLAAEQGNSLAQFHLGVAYQNGEGVPQDYMTAVKWYERAAKQGDSDAQYHLGQMYRKGLGVEQDNVNSAKWYKLAAEQGDVDAQINVGAAYARGIGVPQDYVHAHMWFNIASSTGSGLAAQNRDAVSLRMTPAQIAKAQTLARNCVAKNYKDC